MSVLLDVAAVELRHVRTCSTPSCRLSCYLCFASAAASMRIIDMQAVRASSRFGGVSQGHQDGRNTRDFVDHESNVFWMRVAGIELTATEIIILSSVSTTKMIDYSRRA